MADRLVSIDLAKAVGHRFPPIVLNELNAILPVGPATPGPGSITLQMLVSGIQATLAKADSALQSVPANSVTSPQIADGAVALSDLSAAVQASLAHADTALQSIAANSVASSQILDGTVSLADLTASLQNSIALAGTALQSIGPSTVGSSQIADGTVALADLVSTVQASLAKADSALQAIPVNGVGSAQIADGSVNVTDLAASVQASLALASTALQSIPNNSVASAQIADGTVSLVDLASSIQASLAKADSAIQTIAANSIASSQIIDGTVSLVDLSASLQNAVALANTALQTIAPGSVGSTQIADGGVALADLATGVQASLALANTALQSVPVNSVGSAQIADGSVGLVDLSTALQAAIALANTAAQPFVTAATVTASTAATPNVIVPFNAAAGPLTALLPPRSSANDNAVFGVQKVNADTSVNPVTITSNGSDSFDSAAATVVLRVPGELRFVQGVTIGGVRQWKIIGGNTPVGSLDARYQPVAMARRPATSEALSTIGAAAVTYAASSGGASTTVTSISGGAVRGNVGVAGSVNLIGTKQDKLKLADTGLYTSSWKQGYDGSYGTQIDTSSWGFDFMVAGTRYVEFAVVAYDKPFVQVWVDDRKLTDVPVAVGIGNYTYGSMKIDLGVGNLTPHRVRVVLNHMAVGTIWTEAAGSVWKPAPMGERLFILGDSITQGKEQNTGGELGTWAHRMANLVGIRDYWNGGIVGNGPNTKANTYDNYKLRAANEAAPSGADVVIVGTYLNDKGQNRTKEQIAADFGTVIDTLQAMPNRPLVMIFSAFDPGGNNGADFTDIDAAVRAVCVAKGAGFISGCTGEVVDQAGVTVLQSGPWITAANKGAYIGGDGTHPTDAGHKYLAHRIGAAWMATRKLESLCAAA